MVINIKIFILFITLFIYHFIVYLLMAMSKNIVITMGNLKEQFKCV